MGEHKYIIKKLKANDKKAHKLLFETFYRRLYIFALKLIEDKYAAEEVVSEVFLKLLQNPHKLDAVYNINAYLYTIVRHASFDYLKKNKNSIRLDIQKHDSLISEFIIEEELHARLFKELQKLPPKCKKIFTLCCIDKLKYKDIAKELKISVNTVKSQRARAINLLRIQLKDYLMILVLLTLI